MSRGITSIDGIIFLWLYMVVVVVVAAAAARAASMATSDCGGAENLCKTKCYLFGPPYKPCCQILVSTKAMTAHSWNLTELLVVYDGI
jgi:ABC-type cobalt transport system substrate-binding protein